MDGYPFLCTQSTLPTWDCGFDTQKAVMRRMAVNRNAYKRFSLLWAHCAFIDMPTCKILLRAVLGCQILANAERL